MSWLWTLRCWVSGEHKAIFREARRLQDPPDHWFCLNCGTHWYYERPVPLAAAEKAERDKSVRQGPFPR